MHYLYVEPTRSKADVVINSGKNDVEFDLFVSKIGQLLEEREKEIKKYKLLVVAFSFSDIISPDFKLLP